MSVPLRRSDPPQFPPSPRKNLGPGIQLIDRDHPRRGEVEAFVEQRFRAVYGARLKGHYEHIALLTADTGTVAAAAGVRFAEDEPLFLERYLDVPIETAVASVFDCPVARESIVEIGAFAADGAASALDLFGSVARWLAAARGRRFAVATARPELRRLLDRAGYGLRSLGLADPARLADEASDWGSYYEARPEVFAGQIGASAVLPLLQERLRSKAMARQVRRLRGVTP